MPRPTAAAWLALLAPALVGAEGWAGAAAGGGWASNVNVGVAGAPRYAAAFATAHAHAGGAADLARSLDLSLEASWDWERYQDLPELELHRPAATVALGLDLGRLARLRLAAQAGLRLADDPARRGHDLGASAALRLRLAPRLDLRLGAGVTDRVTSDAAYRGRSARAAATLEGRLLEAVYLAAGCTAEAGDATVSTTVVTWEQRGGAGRGPGRPSQSFGTALVFQPVRMVILGVTGDLSVPLGGGLVLALRARREWLDGEGLAGAGTVLGGELRWSGALRR